MEYKNPSPKDKRILEAHRRRYQQNQNLQEIADAMGKSYDTIRSYFRSESTERIKQLYDEDELEFMRLQIKQEVEDVKRNGKDYISRAIQHEDADDKTLLRAQKEARGLFKDYIHMLQELGILEKPKERKEVEQTSKESTADKLAEYYKERQTVNTEEKEVEAE